MDVDTAEAPEDDRLPARVRAAWQTHLDEDQRSAVVAWASFAATFGVVRGITHWLKNGHGPSGGGVSAGGTHLHHYNLGILLLTGLGAVTIRGKEHHRRHPTAAAAYGIANALIVDEAALLLDLKDVYWAKQGRSSVDLAVGIIAVGGLAAAGLPLWPKLAHEVHR